jgi:hypothetical protein
MGAISRIGKIHCLRLTALTGLVWKPDAAWSGEYNHFEYVTRVEPGKGNVLARTLEKVVSEVAGANVSFSSRKIGNIEEVYINQDNYRRAVTDLPPEEIQTAYQKVRAEVQKVQGPAFRPLPLLPLDALGLAIV